MDNTTIFILIYLLIVCILMGIANNYFKNSEATMTYAVTMVGSILFPLAIMVAIFFFIVKFFEIIISFLFFKHKSNKNV